MGTPSPENVSTKQQRIAMLAKQMPGVPLNSLSHHIDIDADEGSPSTHGTCDLTSRMREIRKSGSVGEAG